MPENYLDDKTIFHLNPSGRFVIGGPHGDAGLTGACSGCRAQQGGWRPGMAALLAPPLSKRMTRTRRLGAPHCPPTSCPPLRVFPPPHAAPPAGRKIIIDTYGGWGAHGGGAFSGKVCCAALLVAAGCMRACWRSAEQDEQARNWPKAHTESMLPATSTHSACKHLVPISPLHPQDPTKVDRSGAYIARQAAKSVVAAKLARRCLVQVRGWHATGVCAV